MFKLSNSLMARLLKLRTDSESVSLFCKRLRNVRRLFAKQRANIAKKMVNPRLLQIHFHTLRHWKATTEYHKTRDILHVMQLLGHRSIKNTLIYTQLIGFKEDEYVSRAVQTAEEAKQLVEGGFEYVCTTPENFMLFRKRK